MHQRSGEVTKDASTIKNKFCPSLSDCRLFHSDTGEKKYQQRKLRQILPNNHGRNVMVDGLFFMHGILPNLD